jgi:hypothetical protein
MPLYGVDKFCFVIDHQYLFYSSSHEPLFRGVSFSISQNFFIYRYEPRYLPYKARQNACLMEYGGKSDHNWLYLRYFCKMGKKMTRIRGRPKGREGFDHVEDNLSFSRP